MSTLTPEVLWAQRSSSSEPTRNHVFLTINASDVPKEEMKLDLQPTYLEFTGKSNSKKATYHVKLEFYAEIDPEESKINHTARDIEMVLRKKELKEEYWPRLLKDSKKMHFLKTDFDKWVDEEEQDAVPEDDDYMSKMAGMQGGGADGGFGGIDFSKLGGGAGGMPDMSAMGDMGAMGAMGGEGGEESDDDDDEMPELEDEKSDTKAGAKADATKTASGIEEIE